MKDEEAKEQESAGSVSSGIDEGELSRFIQQYNIPISHSACPANWVLNFDIGPVVALHISNIAPLRKLDGILRLLTAATSGRHEFRQRYPELKAPLMSAVIAAATVGKANQGAELIWPETSCEDCFNKKDEQKNGGAAAKFVRRGHSLRGKERLLRPEGMES